MPIDPDVLRTDSDSECKEAQDEQAKPETREIVCVLCSRLWAKEVKSQDGGSDGNWGCHA